MTILNNAYNIHLIWTKPSLPYVSFPGLNHSTLRKNLVKIMNLITERVIWLSIKLTVRVISFRGFLLQHQSSVITIFRLVSLKDKSLFNHTTIRALLELFPHFNPNINDYEINSRRKRKLKKRFLNKICNTPVMQRLQKFLIKKGRKRFCTMTWILIIMIIYLVS